MNIHSVYSSIFKLWRAKRFRLFIKVLKPSPQIRILDVGGYPATWTSSPPCAKSVTCLNVHLSDFPAHQFPHHNISTVLGDARNMQTIGDKEYDVVFSNSVIEHVGGWSDQEAFAREVRRVGRKLWVQTPARECLFEPHYLAPFMHWLPRKVQKRLIRWFSLYGLIQRPSAAEIEEMVESIRLLTKTEMQTLFPECEILVEKMLFFFPKSYIAIRKH